MLGYRERLQVDRRHRFAFLVGDECIAAETGGMAPAASNATTNKGKEARTERREIT